MRLGYWIENRDLPFPSAIVGCEAWVHTKRLGIVQGGRRDDCLSLLVTDQGEYIARHVDCLLARGAS